MAKLEYVIKGFGIRGFDVTKHEWEVRKNVFLTVKTDDYGCVSVYDGDVRAGSMPSELQKGLRDFLRTPTSEVQSKSKSVQPVNKGKGQEIPCDIILTGKNLVVTINNIKALQETVRNLKKKLKDKTILMRKVKRKNKDSVEGERVGNKARTEESKTNTRKQEPSNKNQNNSSKRKREDESQTDGYSPKIKKTKASLSQECTEKEENDKKNSGRKKVWDQRQLLPEECHILAKFIGNNWQVFGIELGLKNADIEQIEGDTGKTLIKIKDMLCRWINVTGNPKVCDFIAVMESGNCKSVTFEKEDIYTHFEKPKEC